MSVSWVLCTVPGCGDSSGWNVNVDHQKDKPEKWGVWPLMGSATAHKVEERQEECPGRGEDLSVLDLGKIGSWMAWSREHRENVLSPA